MAKKTFRFRNKRKKYKVTNNQKKKHKKNYRKSKNDYKKSKKGKGFFKRLFSSKKNKIKQKMDILKQKLTPPTEYISHTAGDRLTGDKLGAHFSQKQKQKLGLNRLSKLIEIYVDRPYEINYSN